MKYLRKTINVIYVCWCVISITVATIYVIAMTINCFINGIHCLSADEWCVWFAFVGLVSPIWKNIKDWYKPLLPTEDGELI